MRPAIISIGDLVADLIVAIPNLPAEAGRHQLAQEIRLEPGGGANFLMAGARLGYPMAALGALGDDLWGRQVASLIEAEGVDLSRVRYEGATTQVIVLISQAGEHVFLGKYGHGGTIQFEAADAKLIENSGAIFCAGYTLCEARLVDLTLAALHRAKQLGVPIFFDPGPHMSNAPITLRHEVLGLVDTLLLTAEEIGLVGAGNPADLMQAGPSTIVVKQGAAGCTLYTPALADRSLTFPGYPVPVVDTSAAGDSFNAAFITARLWGWPLADCAKLANAAGAAKVKKLGGGRSVPTLAEVRAINTAFNIGLAL